MPIRVYVQVVFVTFLWGSAFPFVKLGLDVYDAPPLAFAGLRFFLAGLLLTGTALLPLAKKNASSTLQLKKGDALHLGRVFLIGLLSTAIFYGMFFLGMARTSALSASILEGAAPLIGSVMAHFVLHNDKLTRRKIVAFASAFVGVTIITLGRHEIGGAQVSTIGCLLILGGFVAGSAGTMLVITYRGSLSLAQLTGFQMLFGGSILLAVSAVVYRDWIWLWNLRPGFAALWLWLAFVSAAAFRVWYGLVRQYKVTSLSVFSFLTCVWGAVLSLTILRERLSVELAVGLALIGFAIYAIHTGKAAHERELPPETAP